MSDLVQGEMAMAGRGEVRQAEREGAAPRRQVYRRLAGSLSDEQQKALGMITMGVSIRDAGQQLGIHRGTIYRWLKVDPVFRAAYNAWQLEQQESCRAALVKAAEEAVVRVIKSIPIDPNLAWRVIKELGILSRLKPMSVDPSRVEMEIALEDHEEESVLLRRIDREVYDEDELDSPRGELARLLRLKADAERGAARGPRCPGATEGTSALEEPEPPADGVSRE